MAGAGRQSRRGGGLSGHGQAVRGGQSGVTAAEGFRFVQDETTQGTRVGIPKGEEELTEKINEIIDELTESGLYEQWYQEYSDYAASLGIQ